LEIIDNIQEKKTENIIILNSDQLDKRSKLRSFFEKHKDYYCVAFYPDDQQTISKIIFNFFKKNNIKISPKDINLIVSKCNGDRLNLYNELNKIKSYVLNNNISSDVLRKLINLSEDYDLSKLVDNCLATNKKETLNILNENNFTNEDCLLIVRIFLQKSKRLLNLKKNYNKNQNLEFTISSAKPPIFWKDKDIVKKQIHNWNVENIKVLIYRLCKLELLLKKNINNSINLITNF
jgi:DNA polymerase-3 subunit delta